MPAGALGPAGPLVLVLATTNPHKASEIRSIVAADAPGQVELVGRPAHVAEVEETGATFEENARLKAHALARATGVAALADDSGIEVDALGGAPGVRSARYAGDSASDAENLAKLLAALDEVGARQPERRRAHYRAVVVVAFPDGGEILGRGAVGGTVVTEPRGDAGFGYDPVFAPDGGDGRTFAEIDPEEKHRRSHRGQAVRAVLAELAAASAASSADERTRTSTPEGTGT
ncbi:MAG: RdgB/HAM1 family non-canonical purine NTP pyrophosphatase [Actinomycetota bacterium]|nr:RdgB/HAM1 family non-canonical purine NTP pyrophosphatase [Actinomycetota bacterium]